MTPPPDRRFQVVIISEADKISKEAQHALRRIMEKYKNKSSFDFGFAVVDGGERSWEVCVVGDGAGVGRCWGVMCAATSTSFWGPLSQAPFRSMPPHKCCAAPAIYMLYTGNAHRALIGVLAIRRLCCDYAVAVLWPCCGCAVAVLWLCCDCTLLWLIGDCNPPMVCPMVCPVHDVSGTCRTAGTFCAATPSPRSSVRSDPGVRPDLFFSDPDFGIIFGLFLDFWRLSPLFNHPSSHAPCNLLC